MIGLLNKEAKTFLKPSIHKLSLSCLYFYLSFIFIGQYISDVSIDLNIWMVLILLSGSIIATSITTKISQYILKLDTKESVTKKELTICFIVCFLCAFVVLLTYYYAFFPGAFSSDSNGQLLQAVNGAYSDWHPFIHTFLFFTIPIRIFNSEETIVFLQILYFSISLSYLITTIRK